jgi:acetyl-CoA carboxylase biotin carboxyl carrier protein
MFDDTLANRVRPLAEAFAATDLRRLTVTEDGFALEFRRSPRAAAPAAASAPSGPAILPPAADRKPEVVAADLVGVVRFVRPALTEGQSLDGDRDLAFVEALGIRNPVRSRGAGTIAAIFVTDGQPVEYGQPLFAIERS